MLDIILASARPEAMPAFLEVLASDKNLHLKQVSSGPETLEAVRTRAPALVIIDSRLPDTDPLGLIQNLLTVNAMVNTTVISPLSEEDFHEKAEGLGVLCRLPLEPDANDAVALLQKLRRILGL